MDQSQNPEQPVSESRMTSLENETYTSKEISQKEDTALKHIESSSSSCDEEDVSSPSFESGSPKTNGQSKAVQEIAALVFNLTGQTVAPNLIRELLTQHPSEHIMAAYEACVEKLDLDHEAGFATRNFFREGGCSVIISVLKSQGEIQ
jgi:hypothetical protein